MTKRQRLEDYLKWLITPLNDDEKEKFKDLVDSHCEIINRIPKLTDVELIEEINIQLEPYGLQIDNCA